MPNFVQSKFAGVLGTLTVVVLSAFFGVSCQKRDLQIEDPKSRLTEYISVSFAVKGLDDRKNLLQYLTGEAKQRLEAWSDDQFRQAFIETRRQFVKLSFKEIKPINKALVNVVYELTYIDQSKGKEVRVTNRKFCEVVDEKGSWLISSVKNLKELIEYKNEMSLP